jgi:hypothetical protein
MGLGGTGSGSGRSGGTGPGPGGTGSGVSGSGGPGGTGCTMTRPFVEESLIGYHVPPVSNVPIGSSQVGRDQCADPGLEWVGWQTNQ